MFIMNENVRKLLDSVDMDEKTVLGFIGINALTMESATREKWNMIAKNFLIYKVEENLSGMIAIRNTIKDYICGRVLLSIPFNAGDYAEAFIILVASFRIIEQKLKLDSLIDAGKQMLGNEMVAEEEIRPKLRAKYNLYDKEMPKTEKHEPDLDDDKRLLM